MTTEKDLSDMPCPLGCGYRPPNTLRAAVHLAGHATGNYTTGAEQARDLDG